MIHAHGFAPTCATGRRFLHPDLAPQNHKFHVIRSCPLRRGPRPICIASWPGPNPNSTPENEFQRPAGNIDASEGIIVSPGSQAHACECHPFVFITDCVLTFLHLSFILCQYPWNKGYQIWSAIITGAAALTGVVVPLQVALGVGTNS